MLRNLKSPETYFQAAFRVQSPWEFKTDIAGAAPYEIMEFPGGVFLVATGNEKDSDDLNETIDCMMTWIHKSEVFEYGDFPQSGMCNTPNPEGKADSALGIAQQQVFLPLKL